MYPLREWLLELSVLSVLSLVVGAAVMALHGLLRRQLRAESLSECLPPGLCRVSLSVPVLLLLLTQVEAVPWRWLAPLPLLLVTAPVLLAWLGPPDEHVEASRLCQIGRGSAYSHFYGYLRLMTGDNGVRKRLVKFRNTKELNNSPNLQCSNPPAKLSDADWADFFTAAVVVLAPDDGEYPDLKQLEEGVLLGVGARLGCLPEFHSPVGGNRRTYGGFSVHRVTSEDGVSRFVALDVVGALATLRKLSKFGPAGLSKTDCKKQMSEMLDELEKIVADSGHLKGQVKVVRYKPGEHVGDAIMAAIDPKDVARD